MIATAPDTSLRDVDDGRSFVSRQLRIGMDYLSSGRINEAVEAFQRGLAAAAPGDSRLGAPSEVMSELHLKLGNACMLRGDLELAVTTTKPRFGWGPSAGATSATFS